jgi:hypothetical protein
MGFKFPNCIYCSSKASLGCADCGAPMCKKHATIEGDKFKCREHRARIEVAEGSVKGELA